MLKQIVLRQKIKAAQTSLDVLRAKDPELQTRAAALKTREADLEAAVNEVTAETPAEEKDIVDNQVKDFDADDAALASETAEHEAAKKTLTDEITKLQAELDEIENRQAAAPGAPAASDPQKSERTNKVMSNRARMGMTPEQRTAYLATAEVKAFYSRMREALGSKRAVSNGDLIIPEVTLTLLRDNLDKYSKLLKHVRLVPVKGTARQTILGTIPEAVWTEAVGKLNALALTFARIEVDGYKVGGYIPVDNSLIEDNDVNLSAIVEDSLGQALGLAIDKAIVFGTGTKMPIGIFTRLAQTSQPSSWSLKAPTWTDLHSTNIVSINGAALSDAAFFAALALKAGLPKANYSNGELFWVMNRTTYATIQSKAINFNAAGAIVSAANGTMPIIGGAIEVLDFMPDNAIIGGYGSLYLVAERSGASLAVSEHVLFIEDQTVFKATARYDGQPVYGEGFVAIGIANSSPTAGGVSFPSDDANPQ